MKRISFLISIFLLLGTLISCSNKIVNEKHDVREIAFNQLKEDDKKIILGGWKDGELSKIILERNMGEIYDEFYIGKEVYIISFPTNKDTIPNNIIVYLDMDNNKIIGYGFVD